MLGITIHNLGDVTIYRCAGRIVFGYEDRVLSAVRKQPGVRIAVLDLAEVTAIDAAGIGMLVSLRKWAEKTGMALKLMNLTPRVEDVLELFHLRPAFEICSVREMLDLFCRSLHELQHSGIDAAVESPSVILDGAQPAFVGNQW